MRLKTGYWVCHVRETKLQFVGGCAVYEILRVSLLTFCVLRGAYFVEVAVPLNRLQVFLFLTADLSTYWLVCFCSLVEQRFLARACRLVCGNTLEECRLH